ncbi:uncharacterized protein MCYG_06765 [Microsporum canis CBS 113480]|uniref:Secreted protein n=1 Tax=Arthroderma otae (strain ATCC MYA-4605 / CBS 113480) TaxID=554155 RepID=C5FVL2_ARTOC|nr:uncharacterized protein MCYG_06765 [Microsporum canis CBS 113480]EEQ33946.1 predicted protein [Microsporum canis CBS 113480]
MFQGSWMIGAALLLLLHNPRETKKAAAVQEESSHNGDRWVCEYGVRIDEYLLHRLRTPTYSGCACWFRTARVKILPPLLGGRANIANRASHQLLSAEDGQESRLNYDRWPFGSHSGSDKSSQGEKWLILTLSRGLFITWKYGVNGGVTKYAVDFGLNLAFLESRLFDNSLPVPTLTSTNVSDFNRRRRTP